jgi:hypothetical protein
MHFFGGLGTISFLLGFVFVGWISWLKIKAIYITKTNIYRDVVDQPLFFLAIAAIIVGVQLFLAGFLGEMMTMNSNKKSDYVLEDSIGIEKG